MSLLVRFGWTLWALVPVAIIAFHFGPGQELAAREAAVRRFNAAAALERVAIDAQADAYQAHLEAIEARRLELLESPTPLEPVEPVEGQEPVEAEPSERLARALPGAGGLRSCRRELVARSGRLRTGRGTARRCGPGGPRPHPLVEGTRAGSFRLIWDGAVDLEEIVVTMSDDPQQVDLARAAREELAVAHYFERVCSDLRANLRAACRNQGPAALPVSCRDRGGIASPELVRGLEDNVERTIELEQMDKSDLEVALCLAKSARHEGRRPGQGRPGVSQRPQPGRWSGRRWRRPGRTGLVRSRDDVESHAYPALHRRPLRNLRVRLVVACPARGAELARSADALAPPATPIEITLPADALQEAPGSNRRAGAAHRSRRGKRRRSTRDWLPTNRNRCDCSTRRWTSTCSRSSCRTIPRPCGNAAASEGEPEEVRTNPQTVLAARTKLGLEDQDRPDNAATAAQLTGCI